MDRKINTPKAGNGRRMRTIEFDAADAPMLMSAMRLAASTTLCYGPGHERARERFRYYQDLFLSFAPPEAFLFSKQETWCEIAIAMDDAPEYSLRWTQADWPHRDKGHATVVVGERAWTTKAPLERQQFEALATALDELAPAGCMRTAVDDPERTGA